MSGAFRYFWATFSLLYLLNGSAAQKSYQELLQSLEYGESCNYEVELVRQNYLRPLYSGTVSKNPTQSDLSGLLRSRYIATVERLQQPMCNALKLLVCNPLTNICDCGNPGKMIMHPDVPANEGFTVEDEQYCRWAVGGYCTPEMESIKDNASQWCERGALCMQTGTEWGLCSYAKIRDYFVANNVTSTKAGNMAMMSGQICSCRNTSLYLAITRPNKDAKNTI